MKVLFTIIALSLVWLSVKDTRFEPGVTLDAQGNYFLSGVLGGRPIPLNISLDCTGCN